MLAMKIVALAAVGDGADEDCLVRAEVITGVGLRQFLPEIAMDRDEIEDGSSEVRDAPALLSRDVAHHRQCFQINLRTHDRRTEAQYAAAVEPLHGVREYEEIAIAGIAVRRSV